MSASSTPELREPGLLSNFLLSSRNQQVLKYLQGDVLELGCGPATLKDLAGDRIRSYCGIDADPLVLEQAKQLHPDSRFYERDLETGTIDLAEQFDVVLMVALIEHIFNQGHLISQCISCLRPNGRLVLTTPTPFGNDIVHRFGAKLGLFSKLAANDHIVIYNKKRFEILAEHFGLRLETHQTFQLGCNQLAVLQKPLDWQMPKNSVTIMPTDGEEELRHRSIMGM